MRGEKESTRKTFAAKLAVSGKERTWITCDRRAAGPSNIHAFDVQSGFFLGCREIMLRSKRDIHEHWRFEDGPKAPPPRDRSLVRKPLINDQEVSTKSAKLCLAIAIICEKVKELRMCCSSALLVES